MEATHTPGPWEVNTDFDEVQARLGLITVCKLDGRYRTTGEHEAAANVRLIVAAPELLDALRGLVAAVAVARHAEDAFLRSDEEEDDGPLGEALEDAQATLIIRENTALSVIAKALGQS